MTSISKYFDNIDISRVPCQYLIRLAEIANATGMQLQDNSYATVLHDEVWAMALALNDSLETLNSLNM